MSKTLFRGRRKDNGEWVYGYLWVRASSSYITPYNIGISYDEKTHIVEAYAYEVDPSTIGRASDYTDKNGTKVFEGDIISLVTADMEPITITCKFGKVRRQINENLVEITGFYFKRSNDGLNAFPIVHNYLGKHDTEIWEVIGNIHDKPVEVTQARGKADESAIREI